MIVGSVLRYIDIGAKNGASSPQNGGGTRTFHETALKCARLTQRGYIVSGNRKTVDGDLHNGLTVGR